ncbi:hypothetical protein H4219_005917 [Mycoemilia scoparia]|uniref:Carbohydrate-binding module family 96 domain-containing protein n=1 Tax=Mycoemilia scoparia TaxID=417184 RepID=A0A9W7ZKU2_9FUNG|nr:hypothetical protein H4219_005917 [Mycoemilia scoparia]
MKFIASLTLAALSVAGFAQVASAQQQKTYNINAFKDSTLLRSTVSCPNCPNSNCYECSLGAQSTLVVSAGGHAVNYAIIGFTLPSEATQAPDRLDNCKLTLPAPVNQLATNQVVNIYSADPFWDEYSVTANNAPALGSVIGQANIPAGGSPAAVDLTAACKAAAAKGAGFTVILTQGGGIDTITFPSKEAGRPATLAATIH